MGYMKDATGRRLDSFAVTPLRTPTIVLFGDSRTGDCDYQPNALLRYSTNTSWFDWGQAFRQGGPVLDVIANAGVGGNTTTQMLARIEADVFALSPSHMTLWGGTNDGWPDTAAVEASFGRMAQMMDMARARGIYVFVISETTANSKGSGYPRQVAYYNDLLRAYAATNSGVEFWDFNQHVTDPTSANGYHKSIMLRDGLHLSPYGASYLGREVVASRLARFGTDLAQLPASQIDTINVGSPSRQIANNPLMLGTSGTVPGSAGWSGQAPQSWAVSAGSSNVSAAQSVPARTDGIGNALRAEITAVAAGSHYLTQTVDPTRLVAGAKYVLEAACKLEANTGLSHLSLTARITAPAGNHVFGWGLATIAPQASDSIVAGDLVLRSRAFVAPVGATGLSVVRQMTFGGAGSAPEELSRLALRRIA